MQRGLLKSIIIVIIVSFFSFLNVDGVLAYQKEGKCFCDSRHATVRGATEAGGGSVGANDWVNGDQHEFVPNIVSREQCEKLAITLIQDQAWNDFLNPVRTSLIGNLVAPGVGAFAGFFVNNDTIWDIDCRWEDPNPYCCCTLDQSQAGSVTTPVGRCAKITGIGSGLKCSQYIFDHPDESEPGNCKCEFSANTFASIIAFPWFFAHLVFDDNSKSITGVNRAICEQLKARYPGENCRWESIPLTTEDRQYRPYSTKDGECNFKHVTTGQAPGAQSQNFVDIERLKDQAKALNVLNITDVNKLIGRAVKALLAFIGSIALVLYIYTGFTWMTAAGNPERVTIAKKILVWTTLGVVVMLSSYLLVNFVFQNLK